MSLQDVHWTWACQEPDCGTRIQTPAKAHAPLCRHHGSDPMGRVCEICGTEIAGLRADAETCGGACRAERSRRRREAHTGARGKRRTPRRPRTPERGVRVYLLPDELAAMVAPATASRRGPRRRAMAKMDAAAVRLERRSS